MRLLRFGCFTNVLAVVAAFLAAGGARAQEVWRAPAVPGVRVLASGEGGWRVQTTSDEAFLLESASELPARPGEAFEVGIAIRVDIHTRALPSLVSLDAEGKAIGAESPLANAPGTFSTNVQTHRRTFVARPGARSVRAGVAVDGKGVVELSGLRFGPARVDAYQTGALVRPLDASLRKGVVLESNFGVVNGDLISRDDRDGDGRWALVEVNLDRITEPAARGEDWRSRFEVNPNAVFWSDGAVLKSDTVRADRAPDASHALHFRAKVRPGPYRVLVSDPGRAAAVSVDGKIWARHEGGREIDLGTRTLADGVVQIWIDSCYRDPLSVGPVYFDYVRLIPVDDPAAVDRLFRAAARRPERLARGTVGEKRVPVTIDDAPAIRAGGWPARCGLPVPRGELVSGDHVAVETVDGARVPSSARVLAEWPDGSVKWVLVDFVHASSAGRYRVVYGEDVKPAATARAVRVIEQANGVTVDTGSVSFRVPRSHFGIVEDVQMPDGRPALGGPVSVEIVEAGGRSWRTLDLPVARLEVEQAGPMHAVVLAETARPRSGAPASGFAHRVRIHAFANSPVLQLEYFVANTDGRRTPDPVGSMAGSIPVRLMTMRFPLPAEPRRVENELGDAGPSGGLVQVDAEQALTPSGPARRALKGWLSATLQERGRFAVGLEHFREQFPKALRWRAESVDLDLWAIEGGTFDWAEGVGKTHHITLDFGDDPAPGALLARGRLFALAEPKWYCDSGAFGPIGPAASSPLPAVEATLAGHMRDPVVTRLGLGFEDFGDHSSGGYVKGTFLWDNNEYDLPAACLVHFARTGDRDALRAGLASALHYVDVDMVHYSSRRADWHEAPHTHSHGERGHHTAQGPDMSHAGYVQGLIWASYLTGEPACLEGAKGVAAWVLRNLGSHTMGMERQLGHPLMTLNDVYEATGDDRWLRGSARLVDQALRWEHPARGGFLAPITESPAYYSGGPFCGGLMSAGLLKFNAWAADPDVDAMLERSAVWLLTEVWRPPSGILGKGGSPRRRPDPKDVASHLRLMAWAHARTGDPFFLAVPRKSLADGFGEKARPFGTRSTGLVYNYVPWFLDALRRQGSPSEDGRLKVSPVAAKMKVTRGQGFRVVFDVENVGPDALTGLAASCRGRLDFGRAAGVAESPREIPAGTTRRLEYTLRAPDNLNLTCAANATAYVHLALSGLRGGKHVLAHAWVEVEVVDGPKTGSGQGG